MHEQPVGYEKGETSVLVSDWGERNTFQSEVVDFCLQQVEPGLRPDTTMA